MADSTSEIAAPRRRRLLFATGLGLVAATAVSMPDKALETARFVIESLVAVAPLVVPGIVLSAWVRTSGASAHVAATLTGSIGRTILIASAIGAVTPVCGVTVLPLMVGLLASGVPLAPVMAFWLSSPITDPAMLATTAATLGFTFAAGKTIAAFLLGLGGGLLTATVSRTAWSRSPLRQNALTGQLCGSCGPDELLLAIWKTQERRRLFYQECGASTRLILICLVPAFAAEHILSGLLAPEALANYVGQDSWWAVPLAVGVGGPLYIDGYAALPLTRALMDHGMSPGSAMAFLVSGGVVSIYGAMAILPVLRLRPFLLYLGLAIAGSLASGWIFGFIAQGIPS